MRHRFPHAPALLVAFTLLAGLARPGLAGEPGSTFVAIIDGKEAPCPDLNMGDDTVTRAIIDEGKQHNQVMRHLKHLTHDIGARLTGSTNAEKANRWCQEQYQSWGLANPHLEEWGQIPVRFDRGPSSGKVLLRRTTKDEEGNEKFDHEPIRDLVLTTQAWSWGTAGAVRGRLVKEPKTEEEFAAIKPQLAGAWIVIGAPAPVGQRGIRGLVGARYELRQSARKKAADGTAASDLSIPERLALEPVAGYISTSRDERVWTGAVPKWRELDADAIPQDVHVIVRGSDYDFINSRLADGEPIEAEFNLEQTFTKGPIPVYNTVAEIRGTEWPEQVVIVSAHLDSWNGPGSQGCTDNGTGTAVTLEAARILAAVGARPRRTIRFIHWTGEEQGLLGSKEYVKAHAAELENISVMFVDDGGTNTQGGIYCTEEQRDMLAAATAPINNQFYSEVDKKYLNVDVKAGKRQRMSGGSDHMSFNSAGVPGFFWDEIGRADYGYGWHTQNDTYEIAIEEYLVQSSTNAAVTAYRLACADTMLPRPPKPAEGEDSGRTRGEGRRRDRAEDAAPATPPTPETPR